MSVVLANSGTLASTDFFANLEYEKANLNQPPFCDLKPKKLGRVELGGITQHNIKILKRLNQMIFPVNYNEKFYKYVLKAGELAKLAYYNEMIVGAVCCRVEENSDNKHLYIMTLGCLAQYRRLSIGRKMLEHVLSYAEKNKFEKITLHVQVNNETALAFYKNFGFEIVSTAYQYYKRIEPADAHVLQKTLVASA